MQIAMLHRIGACLLIVSMIGLIASAIASAGEQHWRSQITPPVPQRPSSTPGLSSQQPVRIAQHQKIVPAEQIRGIEGPDLIESVTVDPSTSGRLTSHSRRHQWKHGEVLPCPIVEYSLTEDEGTGNVAATEFDFDKIPLKDVMAEMLRNWPGHRFRITGQKDLPIKARIRAKSLNSAISQLEDQTKLLIVRFGDLFVVYSVGAEVELDGHPINYIYKCRQAKAWDLIAIVEKDKTVEPEGLPGAVDPISTGTGYKIPDQKPVTPEVRKSKKGLSSPLGATEYQIVHHFNGVLLRGQYADVRKAVRFLRTIDRPVPIVFVELLIVQYVHEDGYAWNYNLFAGQVAKGAPFTSKEDGLGFDKPSNDPNFYGPRESGFNIQDLAINAATGRLPSTFSSVGTLTVNFRQNLTHLMSENQARIVTNPHIAVINGHKGTVLQNEKFNFVTTDVTEGVSQLQSQTVQTLNAATLLTVTPTLVGSDQIHLAVNATLSAFEVGVAGGTIRSDDFLPDQRANDLATSVVLADRKTLIIGGLVREEMLEDRKKYPFLAKTPLIGHLFRAKTDSKRFIETVIYITPHLQRSDVPEDEYEKQIFEQTEMLQGRGEFIRDKNRFDKYRFESQYRHKERLDHEQHKRLKQEKALEKHHPRCNCQECREVGSVYELPRK